MLCQKLFTLRLTFFVRNQLIAVCSLYANLMLCGFNNVILYADYVIQEAGVSKNASGWATIGIFGLQFVASLLGVS